MKKTDLSYVAGIVDGEGTIGIEKFFKAPKHRHGVRYEMYVTVANTNEWLIQWLKFSFGGSFSFIKSKGDNQKPYWQWRLEARQAANLLHLIIPYLRIKKYQAEVALSFQSNKRACNSYRWNPKTDEELALEEAQYILMRKSNKRGKG